ncbi:hypothetical protein DDV21_009165 [Streptococcus chenjunshii]|uniref:Uncharacterized protein n=1 Tax=Streptococcus chenjunshii TaxID=2173853 RepID=A0A372KJP7_9STRE|nr:hypothetical protein DDV21_009165 [Streptococcus chenjunshii]RFU50268.1 hypothetical protein DDV22_09640 [Streptococcus chenjunshii]RFU52480.1 hypothetical protein DDV23_09555 [Streptococcus chenjunshii]
MAEIRNPIVTPLFNEYLSSKNHSFLSLMKKHALYLYNSRPFTKNNGLTFVSTAHRDSPNFSFI